MKALLYNWEGRWKYIQNYYFFKFMYEEEGDSCQKSLNG